MQRSASANSSMRITTPIQRGGVGRQRARGTQETPEATTRQRGPLRRCLIIGGGMPRQEKIVLTAFSFLGLVFFLVRTAEGRFQAWALVALTGIVGVGWWLRWRGPGR